MASRFARAAWIAVSVASLAVAANEDRAIAERSPPPPAAAPAAPAPAAAPVPAPAAPAPVPAPAHPPASSPLSWNLIVPRDPVAVDTPLALSWDWRIGVPTTVRITIGAEECPIVAHKNDTATVRAPRVRFPDDGSPAELEAVAELTFGKIVSSLHGKVRIKPAPDPGMQIRELDPPRGEPGRLLTVRLTKDIDYLPRSQWKLLLNGAAIEPLVVGPDYLQGFTARDLMPGSTIPVVVFFAGESVAAANYSVATASEPKTTEPPPRVTVTFVLLNIGLFLLVLLPFLVLLQRRLARKRVISPPSTGLSAGEDAEARASAVRWIAAERPAPAEDLVPQVFEPPPELLDALARRRVVLMAGPLFAEAAGIPEGAALLDVLAKSSPAALEGSSVIGNTYSVTVAETVVARIGPTQLQSTVREMLANLRPEPSLLHDLACELPLDGVITTGWDDSFERLLRVKQPVVLTHTEREMAEAFEKHGPAGAGPFVVKLYGDAHADGTLALTNADLSTNVRKSGFARSVRRLWASRTFLFVGFTVDAIADLLRVLDLGKEEDGRDVAHFALVRRPDDFDLQSERFSLRYGLRLVPLGPGAGIEPERDALSKLRRALPSDLRVSGSSASLAPVLESVELRNIGPFAEAKFTLSRNWNVLLGNNGCGKSTLLKAIALGLCGDDSGVRQPAAQLLRVGEKEGSIELTAGEQRFRTVLRRTTDGVAVEAPFGTPLVSGVWTVLGFPPVRGVALDAPRGPTPESEGSSRPQVADLMPLLTGVVDRRFDSVWQWIVNLEMSPDTRRAVAVRDRFFQALNLLTQGAPCKFHKVDRETWRVMVETLDGIVPVERISQGASSILGLIGTLLERQSEIHAGSLRTEDRSAIVLVDEIDAHLHPEWQRSLVPAMRKLFPMLQIIATTHSPLLVGSLQKNELHYLRREDGRPRVLPVEESFEGWRADQILTSPAFNLDTTRSKEVEDLMGEYEALLARIDRSEGEQTRLETLRRTIAETLPAPHETAAGRKAMELIEKVADEHLKGMTSAQQQRILDEARRLVGAGAKSGPESGGLA